MRILTLISMLMFPLFSLLFGCSKQNGTGGPTPPSPPPTAGPSATTQSDSQACLEAAQKMFGPSAQIEKCGQLTRTGKLETVVVVPLREIHENADGIAVAKLAVLQRSRSGWQTELLADEKSMRNNFGYVGIEFIDDSYRYPGYRVSFSDHRSDDVTGFTLYLSYLRNDGSSEGVSTEICWNSAVGRFQEFAYGQDPEEFKPEIKNPPHINPRKP